MHKMAAKYQLECYLLPSLPTFLKDASYIYAISELVGKFSNSIGKQHFYNLKKGVRSYL